MTRIAREGERGCRMCELAREGEPISVGELASVVLSRYPVRWGQLLVIPHAHVERFDELDERAWAEASLLAHRAARALERALEPARCYVASLGTSEPGLPMTFPHLHLHVIPVPERGARPSEVLTWQHGVEEGTDEEWSALIEALRVAW